MLRKLFSFIIVLPLIAVPLFCSCTSAFATIIGGEHFDDDNDSSKVVNRPQGPHDQGHHSHQCSCSHSLIPGEVPVLSHISFASAGHFFLESNINALQSAIFPKGPIDYSYLGPPLGISTVVPLYIQQHSLRI